jgi:hypothetical protein
MEQPFECKYCGVKFRREKTLTTHMCSKKKRYMDIETAGSRFGFRTFQKFYELTTKSKKPKTQQEFIDSPYYTDFAKFGNHLSNLKPIYVEQYIEFVVLGGVKLKDWTQDSIYYLFVQDMVKKEPPTSAAERTITEIMQWAEKNETPFTQFFSDVTANEAAHLIKMGRISPWVLYLCESGEKLMERFNEDHSKMIGDVIDPGFWMKRFKKSTEDVEYIKSILEQAGL